MGDATANAGPAPAPTLAPTPASAPATTPAATSAPAATPAPTPVPPNQYAQEVRFGVVMYGGVSLAIYINGVTNELYEMALATPKAGDNAVTSRTRDVYRKASYLLRDPELRKRYLARVDDPTLPDPFAKGAPLSDDLRTRFVVDTIAGTSAGGINGLFLAKALVNGQKFAPLKELWITESDIDRLLNDEASYDGIRFAERDTAPQSLLNSDRMYVKLLDALRGMAAAEVTAVGGGKSPLVDEIDLYVTTTDIRGAVVPLRLFDKVVYEKRYKQVYHFQYAPAGDRPRNDLTDDNSPFLAFAARCTSSFPFAFEPMTVADAVRLCAVHPDKPPVDLDRWRTFFTGLSASDKGADALSKRAFGDGGYLDNKPFSYVVEALSWRLGGLPMERKLIYVEPSPAHPETEVQNPDKKPDAIQNAVAAIFTIPQDQTIREDIGAVLLRNRRVERVERIVREVEADLDARDADPFARIVLDENGQVPIWRSRGMNDMITYYGAAFLPYWRLRMMTVTDDIADRLAVWWGIDRDSDRLYAFRAIVRVWREDKYLENRDPNDPTKETVNALLDDYDVKYRLRRVGFLLRKVHQLLHLAAKFRLPDAQPLLTEIEKPLLKRCEHRNLPAEMLSSDAVVAVLRKIARGFGEAMGEIRDVTWLSTPLNSASERTAAEERKAKAGELDRVLGLLLGEKSAATLDPLTTAGASVRLPDLPPPSPLRTLQENVFTRATLLFESAETVQKTELQQLLETDAKLLKDAYDKVLGHSGNVALVRALLGNPRLTVIPAANGANKVGIDIGNVALPGCEILNTPAGQIVRALIAEYYVRFDEYDQMSFPLYYDTGTGEPATVEVLRISPEDAPSVINERANRDRQKLAGTKYFHFGAFLDAQWRCNDIMWGRLDGCERLLAALFPADSDQAVREALLQEAQCIIVREEMQPAAYDLLIDRFAQVLAAQKQSTLNQAFEGLMAHLGEPDSDARRTQTGRILKGLLGDAGTVQYLQQFYAVSPGPDTQKSLDTSTRALTITGRILEEAEKEYRLALSSMVWVTRLGRASQALLAISIPGSLLRAVSRHWLLLLYVFEAFIVVGSTLLASTPTRNFAFTALGLTVALHLATLLTGDRLRGKHKWAVAVTLIICLAAITLAAVGVFALFNPGPHDVMCTGGPQKEIWIVKTLCGWL